MILCGLFVFSSAWSGCADKTPSKTDGRVDAFDAGELNNDLSAPPEAGESQTEAGDLPDAAGTAETHVDLRPESRPEAAPFVAPEGLTLLAGGLGGRGHLDGRGPLVRFIAPGPIVVEGGHAYVGDWASVRKIVLATGDVSTLAGSGRMGNRDGTGAAAQFSLVKGMTTDRRGSLYIVEEGRIRRIAIATGEVTTIAGGPLAFGPILDGVGLNARFRSPMGITCDGERLFIADSWLVRQMTLTTGEVTTIAGSVYTGDWQDGIGRAARFENIRAVVADNTGHLYIGDSPRVRRMNLATGQVVTLSEQPAVIDAMSLDPTGSLLFGLWEAPIVLRLSLTTGETAVVVGTTGQAGNIDGSKEVARLGYPAHVALDGGSIYIADSGNASFRQALIATGEVRTLAGHGWAPGEADGVGTDARFDSPMHLTGDGRDELYVIDKRSAAVRQISLSTRETTTLVRSIGKDGTLIRLRAEAPFDSLADVRFVPPNRLLLADRGNCSLFSFDLGRRVATALRQVPRGRERCEAWEPGPFEWDGAGGILVSDTFSPRLDHFDLATEALRPIGGASTLYASGIALDGRGNAYVSGLGGIHKVVIDTGVVTTLPLSYAEGSGADAPFAPAGLIFSAPDHLLVADPENGAVRRVSIATGEMSTWVGTLGQRGVRLGPLPASLNRPLDLFALPGGGVAIVDTNENAVLVAR